jgi:transcriptional regulator GlxA family with amidase domain
MLRVMSAAETPSMVGPKLGVLLFPGFELLDAFGPIQMLQHAPATSPVILIAEQPGPVASQHGLQAVAAHGLDDCPELRCLLVPGGRGTRKEVRNERLLRFIAERAGQVELLASVCTGAALLAKAGVLDGRRATSSKWSFAWVKSQGPRVHWVEQARWVEDGSIFTSSGVAAGMDMALAIIARLDGVQAAAKIALGTEYEWHRDPSWDPFARAAGLVR